MAHSKKQETIRVRDGDGRERILVINPSSGLPQRIIRTPKMIKTHKKGVKGKGTSAYKIGPKKYSKEKKVVLYSDKSKVIVDAGKNADGVQMIIE